MASERHATQPKLVALGKSIRVVAIGSDRVIERSERDALGHQSWIHVKKFYGMGQTLPGSDEYVMRALIELIDELGPRVQAIEEAQKTATYLVPPPLPPGHDIY